MAVILKTMVSNPAEIPFLWMMFEEAADYVDRIVVTEFNQTHSGLERDFLFQNHVDEFQQAFPHLDYLQGNSIPGIIRNASTPDENHHNEKHMRGWFASQLKLKGSDVVFSTDADEVLYSSTYRWVIDHFTWRTKKGAKFRLHQMFYRPNYLWVNKEFVAPVALKYRRYGSEYPNQWRYQGYRLPGFWGVHFSWCIPISEMVKKVKNYSHSAEHGHLDAAEIFIEARERGTFPFDNRKFRLEEIGFDSQLLPASFHKHAHRLDSDVLGPSYAGPSK